MKALLRRSTNRQEWLLVEEPQPWVNLLCRIPVPIWKLSFGSRSSGQAPLGQSASLARQDDRIVGLAYTL